MKQQKLFTFWVLVLVSLALVGCSTSSSTLPSKDIPVVDQPIDIEKWINWWTVELSVDDEVSWDLQVFTSSEVVYAAKKWDSVEAHPAWLTVSVTLDGDVIAWLDIDQQHSSPKSARHQAQFAQRIEWEVVGKKLSESKAVFFSQASTTSRAFNDAIEEIEKIYQQAQS